MSSERTEERLDAMLEALRARPVRFDEITRARIGARLEAALEDCARAAAPVRRWRRGVIAAAVGLAAAAAALPLLAAARRGAPAATGGEEARAAGGSSSVDPGLAAPSATGAVAAARAAGTAATSAAGITPAPAAGAAATNASAAPPASADAPGPAGLASATASVTVSAGESAQLTVDGAAVTVYGPGRLAPAPGGAVVEAAGIVVDRTRGDAPWSVRYHGVKVVATRATFAIDRGPRTRVTVMRGELVLHCPSGPRTIRSGVSATCEPPTPARVTPAPPSVAPSPEPPEPRSTPAAADPYSVAESALRRGDLGAARATLLAIVDAAPDSLDAATALLDLARLAAISGDASTALGYLDRLDHHPHRAALAAPAARLRGTLDRAASLRAPRAP